MNRLHRHRRKIHQGLFEQEQTVSGLSNMGNPLEALSQMIDFEMFRPLLEESLFTGERKSNAGRPPIDCVLMFKVLFLQRYYGLGDHQIQYQITDRTSFRRFLDIESVDEIPDEKTVWKYREALTKAGAYDRLFGMFREYMESRGLEFSGGRIIDASFVVAPRQRNSRDENACIKSGKGAELWNENPHKKCHKDIDARWTKKRDETYYGYKDHTKVDERTKMVMDYETTPASVHDSQEAVGLIADEDEGCTLYLDAGYTGLDETIRSHGMNPVICEKGYRGHPLTEQQKESNRQKSKVRCRVEHVFGFMEQSMHGLFVRTIGLVRAKAYVAMTSLVYNICRFVQILRYHPQWIAVE